MNCTVSDGRVALGGKVTSPVVKTEAVSAVRGLSGVTRIDDGIEVLPLSDLDRSLRLKTYFAVYGYGPLQKYGMGAWPPIRIVVENGQVRLVGAVKSNGDRAMAFVRASAVPGAFSVSNELRVEP